MKPKTRKPVSEFEAWLDAKTDYYHTIVRLSFAQAQARVRDRYAASIKELPWKKGWAKWR